MNFLQLNYLIKNIIHMCSITTHEVNLIWLDILETKWYNDEI